MRTSMQSLESFAWKAAASGAGRLRGRGPGALASHTSSFERLGQHCARTADRGMAGSPHSSVSLARHHFPSTCKARSLLHRSLCEATARETCKLEAYHLQHACIVVERRTAREVFLQAVLAARCQHCPGRGQASRQAKYVIFCVPECTQHTA